MKDSKLRQESIKMATLFLNLATVFLARYIHEAKGNKSKNELLGLHQDKKLLHSKRNSKQN